MINIFHLPKTFFLIYISDCKINQIIEMKSKFKIKLNKNLKKLFYSFYKINI